MVKIKYDCLYRMVTNNVSLGVDQFDEPIPGHHVVVQMQIFNVLSRTPKGAWIWLYDRKKFVNLTAKKQFASNTEREAIDQFLHRNHRYTHILAARINDAKIARQKAYDYKYKMEKEIEYFGEDNE